MIRWLTISVDDQLLLLPSLSFLLFPSSSNLFFSISPSSSELTIVKHILIVMYCIYSSPLHGVIFDLATLLNVTPADSGDKPMEGNIVSDSHWNVGAGARNMLMYLESRGLRVGLLPRILMDNKKLIDGTIKIFEERMDFSFSHQAENSAQSKNVMTNLNDIVAKMSLNPNNVMVVSMSEQVINTAKTMNMYTCAKSLGGKNWKATSAALQQIKEMEDLKAHVEELNGITYRM